jgi:hypothetical protein
VRRREQCVEKVERGVRALFARTNHTELLQVQVAPLRLYSGNAPDVLPMAICAMNPRLVARQMSWFETCVCSYIRNQLLSMVNMSPGRLMQQFCDCFNRDFQLSCLHSSSRRFKGYIGEPADPHSSLHLDTFRHVEDRRR